MGGSKTVRYLCVFIFPRFEVNADRNLNIERSAEKLVALVLSKIRAFITYFTIMHYFTQEKKYMGPLLGMMPSKVLSAETWCIAGHHAQ